MTALTFTSITIIYNPNSTGPSREMAKVFRDRLAGLSPSVQADLVATDHAGHAEELAYDLAMASPRALIISSSGDGGYHEVVNAVMRARSAGAEPITGLLPAGNANDHHKALESDDTAMLVAQGTVRSIDLLRMTVAGPDGDWERFAHSYIGLGLTPAVGKELNKVKLGPVNQLVIAARGIIAPPVISVDVDGRRHRYTNLIFSSVDRMSKVVSLADDAHLADGRFEVTAVPVRSRLHLLGTLIRASTIGLDPPPPVERYAFVSPFAQPVQLDGEIKHLTGGSKIVVEGVHRALECLGVPESV